MLGSDPMGGRECEDDEDRQQVPKVTLQKCGFTNVPVGFTEEGQDV